MTDLLAIIGLLAATSVMLHLVMGAILYRQSAQIRHLGAVCRALAKAVRHQTGTEVHVDAELLGESRDGEVIPEVEDISSMPQNLSPWGVLETPVE